MRQRRLVAAAITLITVATVAGQVPGSATAAPGDVYVALGDSYTAGPLIPNQIEPYGCLKSDHDYPHVAAPIVQATTLRDVSCSGATTDHMFQTQNVWPAPNPPQLDAVDGATTVVTLGIGGNDIGFSDIVQECVTWNPFATPCRNRYLAGGVDQISQRIAAAAPKVASVLAAIHTRAPQADVFVVGYPAILPDTGYGCWPRLPIGWGDVPYLRAKEKELNTMLANQAAAGTASYVNTYTPSIGHDACASSGTRWVEPIIPANPAAPVHPNGRGMTAIGGIVATAIG
ncbi:MAG: SGNH/GDSL hydrolase family protein [Acidimicrobiales bacterium]